MGCTSRYCQAERSRETNSSGNSDTSIVPGLQSPKGRRNADAAEVQARGGSSYVHAVSLSRLQSAQEPPKSFATTEEDQSSDTHTGMVARLPHPQTDKPKEVTGAYKANGPQHQSSNNDTTHSQGFCSAFTVPTDVPAFPDR